MKSPLELWEEKLAALERAEAIASDAARKFELQAQIEEAKERIQSIKGGANAAVDQPAKSPQSADNRSP